MSDPSVSILGVNVSKVSNSQLEERITRLLSSEKTGIFPIETINPEFIVIASTNKHFRALLNNSRINVPDGVGIMWAAKLLGQPLPEQIRGVDLVDRLSKLAGIHGWNVGFIGGYAEVAKKTAEKIHKKYPKLEFWTYEGVEVAVNGIEITINIEDEKLLQNKLTSADITFVALGAPKQEYFIEHLQQLLPNIHKPIVAIGVGGSFDEIAGAVPTTPVWVDHVGLKWLFRLVTQPWRWQRQLRLVQFVYLILVDRIKKYL